MNRAINNVTVKQYITLSLLYSMSRANYWTLNQYIRFKTLQKENVNLLDHQYLRIMNEDDYQQLKDRNVNECMDNTIVGYIENGIKNVNNVMKERGKVYKATFGK